VPSGTSRFFLGSEVITVNPYNEAILFLLLVIIGLIIYFVPSIVAVLRRHHQMKALVALNIFLGFSYIGWVVALVWALTDERRD
jgi:hypothetical protein